MKLLKINKKYGPFHSISFKGLLFKFLKTHIKQVFFSKCFISFQTVLWSHPMSFLRDIFFLSLRLFILKFLQNLRWHQKWPRSDMPMISSNIFNIFQSCFSTAELRSQMSRNSSTQNLIRAISSSKNFSTKNQKLNFKNLTAGSHQN